MHDDYTGIGAIAWDGYATDPRPEIHPDREFFRQILKESGNPILDVGCGTGRLLIPYLSEGMEIEGADPMADQLAICQRKLDEAGLKTKLHQQAMQTLDTGRKYQTIMVPCGTIQIVLPREAQWEGLKRLYDHLLPSGLLILTLYSAFDDLKTENFGEWITRSRRIQPDGTILEKAGRILGVDKTHQTMEQQVRYRLLRGELEDENAEIIDEHLCHADEQIFFIHELSLMLEKSDFKIEKITGNYTMEPYNDSHYVFAFFARK